MGFGQRDLHTNAKHIQGREDEFKKYFVENEGHLTNITITMASMDPVVNSDIMGIDYDIPHVLEFLSKECNIAVRLSCVMNESAVRDRRTMEEYIRKAGEFGVGAVTYHCQINLGLICKAWLYSVKHDFKPEIIGFSLMRKMS